MSEVLALALASAGRRFADRPHWPQLPALTLDDGDAHASPSCQWVAHGARPARFGQVDPDVVACACLTGALEELLDHAAADELIDAGTVLLRARDVPDTRQGLERLLTTALPTRDWRAGDEATLAQALLAHRDPEQLARGVLADYRGLAAAALARAGLTQLPAALRDPVAEALTRAETALAADLARLRRVLDDARLVRLCQPRLSGTGGAGDQRVWAFTSQYAPDGLSWMAQAWDGVVVDAGQGTVRVAVRLPLAVALAWAGRDAAEVVAAAPATTGTRLVSGTWRVPTPPVHRMPAAELAGVSPAQARTALTLWHPEPGHPMHAVAALRAAAAVLADPPGAPVSAGSRP